MPRIAAELATNWSTNDRRELHSAFRRMDKLYIHNTRPYMSRGTYHRTTYRPYEHENRAARMSVTPTNRSSGGLKEQDYCGDKPQDI